MEITNMKLSELKEYGKNAKEHPDWQIEKICKSIKEFGFNDPIAVDENNIIIEGHGRFKAAQKLGMKKVPVIKLDHMNKAQKKAYILAHNKLTMDTGFDLEILQKELKSLESFDFDLDLTGLNEAEIIDAMDLDSGETKFDSSEYKDYEEAAKESSLKSFNVILCCMNENQKEFVRKLIGEEGNLKRTYTAKELREMRK